MHVRGADSDKLTSADIILLKKDKKSGSTEGKAVKIPKNRICK